eukprot:3385309-Amphidinium_carterae.1
MAPLLQGSETNEAGQSVALAAGPGVGGQTTNAPRATARVPATSSHGTGISKCPTSAPETNRTHKAVLANKKRCTNKVPPPNTKQFERVKSPRSMSAVGCAPWKSATHGAPRALMDERREGRHHK